MGLIGGIFAGVCWAVSSAFGQYIFLHTSIQNNWLIPVRMLVAGIGLLIYLWFFSRKELLMLVHHKKDFVVAVLTGIFGTMLFQFTFFQTVQYSNAGTATVLQYLCPMLLLMYDCITKRRKPLWLEMAAIGCSLIGIVFISTHGNLTSLSLSYQTLLWGIGCAVFMALNSLIPKKLYQKYSPTTVMGIAFLSGGLVLSGMLQPWTYEVQFDFMVVVSLFFIIAVGCVIGYIAYAYSVKKSGSVKASLYSCAEPIVATILSIVCFHNHFVMMDLVGIVLIILSVFLLSVQKQATGTE